jgi:arylsulfatase A-like enzyme
MGTKAGRVGLLLFVAFILPLLLPGGSSAAQRGQGAPRTPNIVFIIADDLGINDLSCYGRKDQPTPNLDKLARQGVRFTSAYAAQSVCSPTRAALMTGKTPARLHLTTFLPGRADTPAQLLRHPVIRQQLPLTEKTIAAYLKAAGYKSACIGKWHLGGQGSLPTDHGFDLYYAGQAQTKPSATEGGKGEYDLTRHAEAFIEDNKDRPFFLYLAHNNPHIALVAKDELIAKHKDAFNPVYAAMIETLDDCVGRVLAKLDELGLAGNTFVVFTSDNGGLHVLEFVLTPATFNWPFRAGKGFLYEGGLRVPLLVRWPGKIPPDRVVNTPVISTDWTPTLLAIAGLPPAPNLDGVSLAKLFTGEEELPARPLFWHQPHYTNQGSRPAGAVRDGDWKLIENYEDGRCELFNLAKDQSETTDLAAREPARVALLRGKLEKWRRDVGAQENEANPTFNGKLWKQLYQDADVSRLEASETASVTALKWTAWRKLMDDVLPKRSQNTPGPGAVLLPARTAKVHGNKLRYEAEPSKDTLGFWTDRDDWVEWDFAIPGAGAFEVQLLQGCGKGSGGSVVEVTVNGQALSMTVEETGHFQRFMPRILGTVRFEHPGRYTLSVRAKSKTGGAVMDLRRVVLRAAS